MMAWYDLAIELLPIICSVVCALIVFLRTGKISDFKEVISTMKYRTSFDDGESKKYVQDFEGANLQPVYRLNKQTGELELTDDVVDTQALIDSAKDTCLAACLNRFFPHTEQDDRVADYGQMLDDLDQVFDVTEKAEQYKERYGLDPSLSVEDVFKFVKSQSDLLKVQIDAAEKKMKEVPLNEEAQKPPTPSSE